MTADEGRGIVLGELEAIAAYYEIRIPTGRKRVTAVVPVKCKGIMVPPPRYSVTTTSLHTFWACTVFSHSVAADRY